MANHRQRATRRHLTQRMVPHPPRNLQAAHKQSLTISGVRLFGRRRCPCRETQSVLHMASRRQAPNILFPTLLKTQHQPSTRNGEALWNHSTPPCLGIQSLSPTRPVPHLTLFLNHSTSKLLRFLRNGATWLSLNNTLLFLVTVFQLPTLPPLERHSTPSPSLNTNRLQRSRRSGVVWLSLNTPLSLAILCRSPTLLQLGRHSTHSLSLNTSRPQQSRRSGVVWLNPNTRLSLDMLCQPSNSQGNRRAPSIPTHWALTKWCAFADPTVVMSPWVTGKSPARMHPARRTSRWIQRTATSVCVALLGLLRSSLSTPGHEW